MKATKTALGMVVALAVSALPLTAQFSGSFEGYYAPTNWTTLVYNNPLYQNTAYVDSSDAPTSTLMVGAVNALVQTTNELAPPSIIQYTITLNGSGAQLISFLWNFYSESGIGGTGLDAAYLVYDNGNGLQEVARLDTSMGLNQFFTGSFLAGHTFGFRLYSDNDNIPDMLRISVVPEPSTCALILLAGTGLYAWRRRTQS